VQWCEGNIVRWSGGFWPSCGGAQVFIVEERACTLSYAGVYGAIPRSLFIVHCRVRCSLRL
jgi:hypothetical protein